MWNWAGGASVLNSRFRAFRNKNGPIIANELSCNRRRLCQKSRRVLCKVYWLTETNGNPGRKAFAMNDTGSTPATTAMSLGIMLFLLLIALALYVFYCFCCKRICEKCGVNPGVLIWIPIAQLIPLLQLAKMPVWMILLFLIPVVSLIVGVFMWVKICMARGKSGWLVILLFIPVLNLIFIPYLAFSE